MSIPAKAIEIDGTLPRLDMLPGELEAAVIEVLQLLEAEIWRRIQLREGAKSAPEAAATLLTPREAAARLGVSVRWVYRHADQLGAVRHGKRTLRFSERRLRLWIQARSAA